MALSAVDQNRWQFPREGAFLKPMCWGDRVDLERVDRIEIIVQRKSAEPARWQQTPLTITKVEKGVFAAAAKKAAMPTMT